MSLIKLLLSLIIAFNIYSSSAFCSEIDKNIAIIDFTNNTGNSDFDYLKKGLADSLTNNLSSFKSLSIVERNRLQEILKEQSFSASGLVSQESALRMGQILGTDYIILGSVLKSGTKYEVGIRLLEVESSRVLNGKSIIVSNEENIINSINYLSLEIAKALGEMVSKNDLENAKKLIETTENTDSGWIYISGGILTLVSIISGIAIYFVIKEQRTLY